MYSIYTNMCGVRFLLCICVSRVSVIRNSWLCVILFAYTHLWFRIICVVLFGVVYTWWAPMLLYNLSVLYKVTPKNDLENWNDDRNMCDDAITHPITLERDFNKLKEYAKFVWIRFGMKEVFYNVVFAFIFFLLNYVVIHAIRNVFLKWISIHRLELEYWIMIVVAD